MPRKITIFEPHFHDAHIGQTISEGTTESDETMETDDDSNGGFGKLKLLAMAAIVLTIGGVMYKKFTGDDGLDIEIEELETEEVTQSQ